MWQSVFFPRLRMWVWSEWATSRAQVGLDWWLEWAVIGPDVSVGLLGLVAKLGRASEWASSKEVLDLTLGLI